MSILHDSAANVNDLTIVNREIARVEAITNELYAQIRTVPAPGMLHVALDLIAAVARAKAAVAHAVNASPELGLDTEIAFWDAEKLDALLCDMKEAEDARLEGRSAWHTVSDDAEDRYELEHSWMI